MVSTLPGKGAVVEAGTSAIDGHRTIPERITALWHAGGGDGVGDERNRRRRGKRQANDFIGEVVIRRR